MASIVYRQMPALRELPQQSPPPGKRLDAKPKGGDKVLVQIPGGVWGGGDGYGWNWYLHYWNNPISFYISCKIFVTIH